jgi:hypothetical protein
LNLLIRIVKEKYLTFLQRRGWCRLALSSKGKENIEDKDRNLNEIRERHKEEMNNRSRERLQKQYVDIRNLGIILVDFVPYERKQDMIEGLRNLFKKEGEKQPIFVDEPRFDMIPDIKDEGIFSGGGTAHIGSVISSDLDWQPLQGIQRKLPNEFVYLDVTIGQFVDFSYWIAYAGLIKETHQNQGIERVFVESRDWVPYEKTTSDGRKIQGMKSKGPQVEQTIRNCQKALEDFLRPYSTGLFLNKLANKTEHFTCPNLKILSTQKIDFGSFQEWEMAHSDFMRFIGFERVYSRFDNMIVGYYPETAFRERSISQGLVFLASKADFKGDGYLKPEDEIFDNVRFLLWDLAPLLHVIYWSSFAVEINRRKWEEKVESTIKEISSAQKRKPDVIQNICIDALNSYREFNQYFIEETKNLESLKQRSAFYRRLVTASQPLNSKFSNVNPFDDLAKYADRLLSMEKDMLENLKGRFDLLLTYSNMLANLDLSQTNINLQKSMKWMTLIMLVLTIAATVLTILIYGPTIWNWLRSILQQDPLNALTYLSLLDE